jgi:hypothetical protein
MAQEKNVACICPSTFYNERVRENAVKGENISGSIMKTKSEDYASIPKLFKYWTIKDIDRILRFIIIDPQDVEIQ